MSVYKLLLCPADPDNPAIDSATLVGRLRETGLTGNPVSTGTATVYPTGERFLQLITFLGCSPAIELDLPAGASARAAACDSGAVCHIRLSQTSDGLRFRADSRMAPPRCPACRQPLSNWTDRIDAWRHNPARTSWQCRHCHHQGRLFDLNFRKNGGFGHTFIEIWGIHPSEAVPVPALLDTLENLSGCPWQTLYIKD